MRYRGSQRFSDSSHAESPATAQSLSASISYSVRFREPLLRSCPAMGTATLQLRAASAMFIESKFVLPSRTSVSGCSRHTFGAHAISIATTCASGGGTEFPNCRSLRNFGTVETEPKRESVQSRDFPNSNASISFVNFLVWASESTSR